MIPRIIHYCWFGGKELPELAQKCIETWNDKCADYQIMRWDESSFDINSVLFVKEAYLSKKYAFVSDYVRLWAIYNYGGVYLDTDVEICKSLDGFLEEKAFSGFESYTDIPTGIMAGEAKLPIYKELLDYYDGRHFVDENGKLDITTNVTIITDIFMEKGLIQNNSKQTVEGFTFYPQKYFCPNDLDLINRREDIYTIHHFAGSWLSEEELKKRNSITYRGKWWFIRIVRKIIISVIGEDRFNGLRGRNKN